MKITMSTVVLLLCILATHQVFPVIVRADIMVKKLENGRSQWIVLLGDLHMQIGHTDPDTTKKIAANSDKEQSAVINCARAFNALVLVEDMKKDTATFGFNALGHWLRGTKQFSTFLFGLTEQCEKNGILCINTETRSDALTSGLLLYPAAILSANMIKVLLLMPYFLRIINNTLHREIASLHFAKHRNKYLLSSATPFLFVLPTLYSAYHRWASTKRRINVDEKIAKHISTISREVYAKKFRGSSSLRFTGWQVDAEILLALNNHKDAETIFICAGAQHTISTKEFLEQQGYVLKATWEDQLSRTTSYAFVDLANALDVESFITSNLKSA